MELSNSAERSAEIILYRIPHKSKGANDEEKKFLFRNLGRTVSLQPDVNGAKMYIKG